MHTGKCTMSCSHCSIQECLTWALHCHMRHITLWINNCCTSAQIIQQLKASNSIKARFTASKQTHSNSHKTQFGQKPERAIQQCTSA